MTQDKIIRILDDENADTKSKLKAYLAADSAMQEKYFLIAFQLLTPENQERLCRFAESLTNEQKAGNHYFFVDTS